MHSEFLQGEREEGLTDCYVIRFTSIGILHVTKKKVPEVLTKRLTQQATARGQLVDQMDMDMDTSQLTPGEERERGKERV